MAWEGQSRIHENGQPPRLFSHQCAEGSFSEVCEMSVVVTPSARETFTPRELTDAYKQFEERGPQYVNSKTDLRAATYWFGTRVLLVYEESEAGVVVLIHPTS
jgi:hypothetical protein